MKYELWYSVVVRDHNAKVISRERRRSRSFLKQWNQMVYIHMAKTSYDIKRTNGYMQSSPGPAAADFKMNAGAGVVNYGIVVGTGVTPVAIDDYALETPIGEGTGVNQMNHLACTVATSVVAAPSCYFVVSRSMVNNSAAEITVKEAGIYVCFYNTALFCCVIRDVFDTPQAVPTGGGTLTINWTIKVTV